MYSEILLDLLVTSAYAFNTHLFLISLSVKLNSLKIYSGGSMPTRTTHRSKTGKNFMQKETKGSVYGIQTYKRAHGQDVKRKSKTEK